MSWSWSHTEDGIANVMNAIAELDDETLATVYAEWSSAQIVNGDYVHLEERYDAALEQGRMLAHNMRPELVEFVQDKTCQHSTCDNGGFEAHICPHGCHRVSFGELEDDDDLPF